MSKPIIHGTAGDDSLTGTSGNDFFSLGQGGSDSASGLGGNDTFSMQGVLDAGDRLDGGAGNDVVILNGDYSGGLTFNATTLTSIETLRLDAGFSYDLTSIDATVAAGAAMKVDGSRLGAGDTLTFDGSAESDGLYHLIGGAGDDVLTGGSDGNTFNLSHGGEDTATGGSGDDVFTLGATLDAGDKISGGFGGDDVLRLDGDYSAGVTLGPDTLSNISTVQFHKGHSYNLTVDNANFLSGRTALINASALGGANSLTFDASASDANFHFIGGVGNDVLTGGAASANFDLSHGGHDTATGGAGNDSFNMGTTFTAADRIDGGAGNDTVVMDGMGAAGSLTFSATTMVNVETLTLQAGHNYDLITNDATVAAGATLLVAGNTLGASDTLTFDGSAETDGHFIIRGGAGNDNLTGGQDGDTFNLLAGGNDTVHGGAGDDTVNVGTALTAADSIDGGAGNDSVNLDGDYSAGLTLGATTMTSVDNLSLATGHSYNLTTNDATVASGQTLTVNASALGAGDNLTFDSSAETDGNFSLIGGTGNDNLTGGAQGDAFDLSHGGNDTAHGGGGDDVFNMGAVLTAADSIDGGAGNDVVNLDGDYSAGLIFGASTITNVESLNLAAGNSYNLTTNDANVASGQSLTIGASGLAAGDTLTFDGSAETDGSFNITGGAGNDALTGGAQADTFDLSYGGNDTVHGGSGDDVFNMGAALTAADSIDGGAGNNTVNLDGDYSAGLTFGASTMTNVDNLTLTGGHSYNLTTDDGTVANGQTLTVNASTLGAGDGLTFDGSAETDGSFSIIGGAGNDNLSGGVQADTFDLTGGGNDTAHGGGGNDTFTMGATLTAADSIDGGTGSDTVNLNGDYSAGLTFGATTITNVENLVLAAGHSYDLTTNDANVASGQTLTIDGSALGAGDALIVDGLAETNGNLNLIGGAGNDSLTGGAGNDSFDLSHGGNDNASSAGGNDTFNMGAAFTAADNIDGGSGSDTLNLNGDYTGANAVVMSALLVNVETIGLAAGHSYDLTTNDANVASLQTLTIDGSALGAGDTLTFNGAAETNGSFLIIGGAGDDVLTGGSRNDTYDLSHGGNDTATDTTGAANDTFNMGAALTAADKINGGFGFDVMNLNGDYSAGVTFSATTMVSVETLNVAAGYNYNLTTNDANVGFGSGLTVNAATLGAANSLTFDGSAETDGTFAITGGAGNDVLTGGAQADTFDLTHGGNDNVTGGAGDDTITMGAALSAADSIDGGTGNDTVNLSGDYSAGLTFGATTMTNVESLVLAAGHSYNLTTNDANVASGQTLTVDASALGVSNTLTFNGAAETNGSFVITAGAGNDTLTGGAQGDTFNMGANLTAADSINGGAGNDTVNLNGDYSAGVTFGASTIANVENLVLAAGHSYNLTTNDANVAAAQFFTVNAAALGAGNNLTFNGSAETNGFFYIYAGAGVDTLTVGSGGGEFFMGANLTAADTLTGGAGGAAVTLNGDYSAGLTLGATTFTNISELGFFTGNSYNITTNDATVASGKTFEVLASPLGAGNNLTFNGSAETDGSFIIYAGAGNDTLTGGAQGDTFNMGANLTAADTINGGAGSDNVNLSGDYSAGLTLGASTITNVEDIILTAGHNYNLTTNDANVASGQSLEVDASLLGAGNILSFNGSAETNGSFFIYGGAGNDTLAGGAQADVFYLNSSSTNGNDSVTGGGGKDAITASTDAADHDTFVYNAVTDSTSTGYDHVQNVQWASDVFHISGFATDPTAINTAVTTGSLSTATFDTDLASDIGAGQLGAHSAALFTASGGTLSGHTFLIVDINGTAGYQAGADLVIEVAGSTGTLTTSSFT